MSGHRRFQKTAIQNNCIGLIFGNGFTTGDFRQQKSLDLLYHETPRFWELCQVVGKWVWIQFDDRRPADYRRLSQFGFHWNRKRQLWQHPCGQFVPGSRQDPRQKYQTYFPADAKAA